MQADPLSRFAELAQRHLTMFAADADGVIRFVSKPLAQALGIAQSQLVGSNWLDYAKPIGATDTLWMSVPFRIPDDAESVLLECKMTSANGIGIYLEIDAFALNPQKTQFAMVCRDFTQQKQKENRLIERIEILRKALEGKEAEVVTTRHATAAELTKEILHEASQPLTAIRCYGGIAKRILQETEQLKADEIAVFVETIIRSAQLTADILRRFCDSTCGRSAVLATEDVSELVDDVTQLLAFPLEHSRVTLQTNIDPGLASLDRTQIQQVLLNLIRNSIEATEDNQGKIEVSALRKSKCWEFTVTDNGPGVEKGQIGRLFLPLKSRKKNGAGLGLSVAQSIVRCHGGAIRYSPLQPTGARFRFELPVDTTPKKHHGLVSISSSSPQK